MFKWKKGNVNDGMAAAEHLVAGLLFASGKWYMNDPTVELKFRDPNKSMLTAYKSYEVVNRDGWLLVRKSTRFLPDWSSPPLLRTKSPAEAVQFMAADSRGYIVKVGVECKDGGGVGNSCQCRDAVFWDIKFESRPAGNNAKANAVANRAANKLNAR